MSAEEIAETIDERLRTLANEIETLTAARAALASVQTPEKGHTAGTGAADAAGQSAHAGEPARVRRPRAVPEPRGRVRQRPSRSRNGRARGHATTQITQAELLTLLAGAGEVTTTEVAGRIAADRDAVLELLRALEASGKVRRLGEKRGTRWRAITDEDWVEQRAAELAARSRAAAA